MTSSSLQIDIWSDVVCPFCYIGRQHLNLALETFKKNSPEVQVRLQWRSFELDANAPASDERNIVEILSQKYGRSHDDTLAMINNMQKMGESAGLTLNMSGVRRLNTFDLHRLLHFAATHNKQDTLKEALMKAYFVDNLELSNHDVLLQVVTSVSLPESEAKEVLASDRYTDDVRTDQQLGREYGIQGVPFFVFNQKVGVSGAQPVPSLLEAIQQSL